MTVLRKVLYCVIDVRPAHESKVDSLDLSVYLLSVMSNCTYGSNVSKSVQ